MSREISTIVTGMSYLEGPRWHDQRIWFSDFYTNRVYSAAEDGSDLRTEAEVPQQPSGLGWLPDGRLLVVSMRDGRLLRREADGTLACHADLSGYLGGHLNDMVVDAQGRGFVGEFGFDLTSGADLKPAPLPCVAPARGPDVPGGRAPGPGFASAISASPPGAAPPTSRPACCASTPTA